MTKPKVFKSIGKLDPSLIATIKETYPYGFDKKLIMIPAGKKLMSVLPFETEEFSYLIKCTLVEAQSLYIKVEIEEGVKDVELDINEILELEGEEKEKVPKKRGRKPKQKADEQAA